uniref:Uncharacterized protein n=1 Tax=Anopheles darlingi TaxID=43151 RepID=A0A2M4D4T2_ANODA
MSTLEPPRLNVVPETHWIVAVTLPVLLIVLPGQAIRVDSPAFHCSEGPVGAHSWLLRRNNGSREFSCVRMLTLH